MSGASRRKGAVGERECAQILRRELPEIAEAIRRGWQARLGSDAPDIDGIPGFWVEHKSGKDVPVRAALKQAINASNGRAIPVAIVRDTGFPERTVHLRLTDFCRVLRAAYGHTPPLRSGVQAELFEEGKA